MTVELLIGMGLTEEAAQKVFEAHQAALKDKYVPIERFNEINEAKKQLDTSLKDRDKQLKDLGEKAKGNDELTKQIADLQESNKKAASEYESKIRSITMDNAIRLKLKENKAKYDDLLMTKFDRDKLKLKEDGSIEGLDEQFTAIKEGYKDLFDQPLGGKTPPNNGGSSAGYNPWKKESFNLTEQGKIYKENPDLAKNLMSQAGISQ